VAADLEAQSQPAEERRASASGDAALDGSPSLSPPGGSPPPPLTPGELSLASWSEPAAAAAASRQSQSAALWAAAARTQALAVESPMLREMLQGSIGLLVRGAMLVGDLEEPRPAQESRVGTGEAAAACASASPPDRPDAAPGATQAAPPAPAAAGATPGPSGKKRRAVVHPDDAEQPLVSSAGPLLERARTHRLRFAAGAAAHDQPPVADVGSAAPVLERARAHRLRFAADAQPPAPELELASSSSRVASLLQRAQAIRGAAFA
jgi:hypothetical protein